MVEEKAASIEEYELPKAILQRLMKQHLGQGALMQAEAKTALIKSCTVFVNYLVAMAVEMKTNPSGTGTSTASNVNLTPDDVWKALEELDMEELVEKARPQFEAIKKSQAEKRAELRRRKSAGASTVVSATDHEDHNDMEADYEEHADDAEHESEESDMEE